ncbi:hypothetical protein AYI70_g93 [Smittium culicis]|uniref:RRM domain-containing protein n=1 Tax=Smittium culicis TaxID=133412 RepID=A0A1R1YHZ7_9FUNG|nr:hypothetical protein AYI70_g93 [Smittium culicis]
MSTYADSAYFNHEANQPRNPSIPTINSAASNSSYHSNRKSINNNSIPKYPSNKLPKPLNNLESPKHKNRIRTSSTSKSPTSIKSSSPKSNRTSRTLNNSPSNLSTNSPTSDLKSIIQSDPYSPSHKQKFSTNTDSLQLFNHHASISFPRIPIPPEYNLLQFHNNCLYFFEINKHFIDNLPSILSIFKAKRVNVYPNDGVSFSGDITFKNTQDTERAYALLNGKPLLNGNNKFILSPNKNHYFIPNPSVIIIKNLPQNYSLFSLYSFLRPIGPIFELTATIIENKNSLGHAFVKFFYQKDEQTALKDLQPFKDIKKEKKKNNLHDIRIDNINYDSAVCSSAINKDQSNKIYLENLTKDLKNIELSENDLDSNDSLQTSLDVDILEFLTSKTQVELISKEIIEKVTENHKQLVARIIEAESDLSITVLSAIISKFFLEFDKIEFIIEILTSNKKLYSYFVKTVSELDFEDFEMFEYDNLIKQLWIQQIKNDYTLNKLYRETTNSHSKASSNNRNSIDCIPSSISSLSNIYDTNWDPSNTEINKAGFISTTSTARNSVDFVKSDSRKSFDAESGNLNPIILPTTGIKVKGYDSKIEDFIEDLSIVSYEDCKAKIQTVLNQRLIGLKFDNYQEISDWIIENKLYNIRNLAYTIFDDDELSKLAKTKLKT